MAFSDPEKIIQSFGLSEGQRVADLGAGSGHYSFAAAKAVGEGGRVYSVDVQQDLLSRLQNFARQNKIRNIEVIHGDIERQSGTRIKEQSVDAVLVCNVFFQVEKKEDFLKEVKRILRPGGRMLLVDWSDSFGGLGPQPEFVIDQQKAIELCTAAGMKFMTTIDAGDHHYGLTFAV